MYFGSPSVRETHSLEVLALVGKHAARVERVLMQAPNTVPAPPRCASFLNTDPQTLQTLRTPAMWPDEMEFLVKLMINQAPQVYVEYGSGGSTNWYPVLAHR
eukprot:CAMPEP_0196580670 /NCGR_PEP_ID=MMETSP1081-20130531/29976_1 /TAXON_ID=36882 /ORGANISM="Pyramimonas amylifera, Strain CCMP720" /LENGTH=101 /DNA_ID=CAMNT_0041900611 /DNA_START=312 /DNA_END=613 /DNA_ORIENTATION=+